jgi:hypothetical protein
VVQSRYYRWGISLSIVALLLGVFPPFHFRKLSDQSVSVRGVGSTDIANTARAFWNSSLLTPRVPPTDWQVLLQALARDPVEGGRAHGRRPGIGGAYFYLVSGEARVASIDARGVWLEGAVGGMRAVLQTGPIFGSALRDATGLLKFEDFSSFDFNELSAQLNHLSETAVQPLLRREAHVGEAIQFLAAGRLNSAIGDGRTLLLAPIWVQIR